MIEVVVCVCEHVETAIVMPMPVSISQIENLVYKLLIWCHASKSDTIVFIIIISH